MFYDQATIKVKAGDGGGGLVSFFRTKGITHGGPDGGDGGDGGSIYLVADNNINALSDFIRQKVFKAKSGEQGGAQRRHGHNGEDLILRVPVGTMVLKEIPRTDNPESAPTKEVFLFDLKEVGEKVLLAKGGKGGFGNAHFSTSTRQTPKFAEYGSPGDELILRLELRLVADVGLVGFPNCGKSTLLARVTSAKPKIANYPFTTIIPNLGVMRRKDVSLVLADIPGLIEGASAGKGLGYEFLRHIKRTRLIIHMIDGLSDDWFRDYCEIRREMEQFDKSLITKKEIIAINKIDAVDSVELKAQSAKLKKALRAKNIHLISAVTGKGVKELFDEVLEKIQNIPIPEIDFKTEKIFTFEDIDDRFFEVKKVKSGFRIYCKKVDYLAKRTDFSNWQALERVRDVIKKLGIEKQMNKEGLETGSLVWIGEKVFEW